MKGLLLGVLVVGCLSVSACGSDDDAGSDCDNADGVVLTGSELTVNSACVDDHVHAFQITSQQLVSPPVNGITAQTTTDRNHSHTVSLTQSEVQQIQAGQTINKITAAANNHTHVFRFRKSQ